MEPKLFSEVIVQYKEDVPNEVPAHEDPTQGSSAVLKRGHLAQKDVTVQGRLMMLNAAATISDDTRPRLKKGGFSPHLHTNMGEFFMFCKTSGAIFIIGETEHAVKEDMFIYVPPNMPHAMRVTDDTEPTKYWVFGISTLQGKGETINI